MEESRSEYFKAYAAIMKITLRDGDASEEEKDFLQSFGKKLGVSSSEYFELVDTYMEYEITAPYTYNERLESLYKLTEIVYNDDGLNKTLKEKWLKRMAIAIGFDPSNIKYVVAKSFDLFNDTKNLDLKTYKESIKNIMH
ncbi:hypothetical protein [Flavivirga spongiicola]|uniref:TerB family tellurite resistance protein n=1 Tax=Flavivirga spongiicola TaxID=421621 RepID=A0ABU7XVT1_9FLAO|nr:hypothetical protein [Flavivirga sp. MEBiC05379]MDO5979545.1 hypothetical protein [Flavivirga sp. MEBiC05379]